MSAQTIDHIPGVQIQRGKVAVEATINNEPVDFLCEPRESLLEVLRDRVGLTGAKEGCNNGNCGACNVILDGRIVNSCCVLGVEIQGKDVLTTQLYSSKLNGEEGLVAADLDRSPIVDEM